jgi:hypothetical protein
MQLIIELKVVTIAAPLRDVSQRIYRHFVGKDVGWAAKNMTARKTRLLISLILRGQQGTALNQFSSVGDGTSLR